MTVGAAQGKRAASCLLAIVAVVGVGAVACSETPAGPGVEEGALTGSNAQDVDPVRQMKERQNGGGGGGGY